MKIVFKGKQSCLTSKELKSMYLPYFGSNLKPLNFGNFLIYFLSAEPTLLLFVVINFIRKCIREIIKKSIKLL